MSPETPPYRSLAEVLEEDRAEEAEGWVSALVRELSGPGAELGLAFCDDATISELNRRYRQREGPTDVLSFPTEEAAPSESPEGVPAGFPVEEEDSLGDVLISLETARRQAAEAGESLSWELQCLILHGLLHCLGHDHEADGGEMDGIELGLRERWVSTGEGWTIPEDAQPADEIAVPPAPGGGRAKGRFGRVALVGRPNAGKSTLMNRWLGEKLSIVSDKPQTTRQRMVGILNGDRGQMVFFDTPGIHKPRHRLNRRMVKAATDALREADVVCLLVDASVSHGTGDEFVLDLVAGVDRPKVALLNKIDRIRKSRLLPLIERYSEADFDPVIPISALDGDGAEVALEELWEQLPAGAPEFDSELLTTQTERFLVTERIREKVLERTRDELPFVVATVIEHWQERDDGSLFLGVSLLVEKSGQKKILIGRGGSLIKSVGIAARKDLEEFLGRTVHLDLLVKERRGWREDAEFIAELESAHHR